MVDLNVPPKIAAIIELLHTQDNRITSHPLFAVQQKRQVAGLEDGYEESHEWINEDCEAIRDAEEIANLEAAYREGAETPGARRIGVAWHWEFVTGCMTEQGCKDFLACNGHNLNEPRIYAYSGYRNAEFIAVREWLMSLRTHGQALDKSSGNAARIDKSNAGANGVAPSDGFYEVSAWRRGWQGGDYNGSWSTTRDIWRFPTRAAAEAFVAAGGVKAPAHCAPYDTPRIQLIRWDNTDGVRASDKGRDLLRQMTDALIHRCGTNADEWPLIRRAEEYLAGVATCEAPSDTERLNYLIANELQVFEVNESYWLREVTEAHPEGGAYERGAASARAAIDASMRKGAARTAGVKGDVK
jgi:hypothetical protein